MIQKNVKYFMLGTADLTLMTAGTVISSAADMTEGQLAIVNSTNTTVTTDQTGTAPYLVRVVQRVGDELVYSPFIDCSKLRGVRKIDGVNPSEQVSFVGYNGTSGALEDAASSDYIIKAIMKNVKTTYNTTPDINHWSYKSAASTSEAAVAKGLLDSFNAWAKRNPEDVLRAERVAATTSVAALTGSGVIYKLTKGLKAVSAYTKTVAASAALTASTASVTAGDTIHIASTGAKSFSFDALDTDHVIYIGSTSYVVADAGTAADGSDNQDAIVTAINAGTQATAVASSTATVTITYKPHIYGTLPPMVISDADGTPANIAVTALSGDLIPVKYKVSATTSAAATFELDAPWQGETGYLYESTGATTTSSIGVATLNGDTWGLKFTGKALPVDAEKWNYEKVRFELGLDGDFASTVPVTYSVKANEGIGTKAHLGIIERQAQMNEGQAWVNAYPSVNHRSEIAKMSDSLFPLDQVIVDFYDDNFVPLLGDTPKSYGTVVIATPNGTGQGLIGDVFGI